jgi:hypothetical protein
MALTRDPVTASVAVKAARQLALQFGLPRLPLDVEAALYPREGKPQPGRFVDPVALASLIVSTAGLAWQIYSDKKKEGEKPTRETLARIVRIRRRESSDLTGAEEKIIEVVAAEIIKAGDDA